MATYSDFHRKLKSYFDAVLKDHVPLFVTRAKGESLVVMSKEDYESIMETFFLLKSPKNAERLQSALDEYNLGEGKERKLTEG